MLYFRCVTFVLYTCFKFGDGCPGKKWPSPCILSMWMSHDMFPEGFTLAFWRQPWRVNDVEQGPCIANSGIWMFFLVPASNNWWNRFQTPPSNNPTYSNLDFCGLFSSQTGKFICCDLTTDACALELNSVVASNKITENSLNVSYIYNIHM